MAAMSLANGAQKGPLTSKALAPMSAKTWGDALRFVRVERGFSYRDVANSVCRDRPNDPKMWELGVKTPDKYDLRRLYNALPKLRNAVDLLPAHLREDQPPAAAEPSPGPAPSGPPEASAPVVEAMIDALKAEVAPPPAAVALPDPAPSITANVPPTVIVPAPAPTPPRWKTFGEALSALIVKEGMNQHGFARVSGISQSTISAYILGYRSDGDGKRHPTGMSHLVYDRLLALLPDLKYAPRPRVSSKSYKQIPGRQTEGNAIAKVTAPAPVAASPKGAIARPPEDEIAPRERRPLPPMPETMRKAAEPIKVAPAAAQDRAKAITEAAQAWGAALANVERLRALLTAAEAEVTASYERVQGLVGSGKGTAR